MFTSKGGVPLLFYTAKDTFVKQMAPWPLQGGVHLIDPSHHEKPFEPGYNSSL